MTMQEKKAKLLDEILAELGDRCYFCKDYGETCHNPACPVNDDAKTAILSLDDPANWPQVFEK